MDARDDFIEDGECHSNNSQEPEEQDSTSGELHGFICECIYIFAYCSENLKKI